MCVCLGEILSELKCMTPKVYSDMLMWSWKVNILIRSESLDVFYDFG